MKAMGPQTDFRVSITNSDDPAAYPISTFTWFLLHKKYADAAKAKALIQFVWYDETQGQSRCADLGYAPLPKAMTPWIEARLKSITAGGKPVWTASK